MGDERVFETGAKRNSAKGKGRFDLIDPFFLEALAKRLEEGAENYGDRNWEKGIPDSSFADSVRRHLNMHLQGRTDEDHLAAAAYNVMCLISQRERRALGLMDDVTDDLPKWEKRACPSMRYAKVNRSGYGMAGH